MLAKEAVQLDQNPWQGDAFPTMMNIAVTLPIPCMRIGVAVSILAMVAKPELSRLPLLQKAVNRRAR